MVCARIAEIDAKGGQTAIAVPQDGDAVAKGVELRVSEHLEPEF